MRSYADEHIDTLFHAILTLKDVEECYRFFEDVCTIPELKELGVRLEVARLLKSGEKYSEICNRTGTSTATISRVNKCLQYGSGGYNLVLDRLESKESEEE